MTPRDGSDDASGPSDPFVGGRNRLAEWTRSRWNRFDDWRTSRPFLGGVLLCLAGLLIAWVPMQTLPDFLFIGGRVTGFLAFGTMVGVFVFLSGVYALYRPTRSHEVGVVGVVLSILSLFGSLGGLVFGMLFGIIGGNLCLAWKPDDAALEDEVSEASPVDDAIARMRAGLGGIVEKTESHRRDGDESITESGVDE